MDSGNIYEPGQKIKLLFQDVEIKTNCPLIRYFRSGPEMILMAQTYEKEGDIERAFMLYYKYITLFLEKIPNLPQYKSIPLTEKNLVKQTLKQALPKAEELKAKVLEKYTGDYDRLISNQKEVEKSIKKENEERENIKLAKLNETIKSNELVNNISYNNIPKDSTNDIISDQEEEDYEIAVKESLNIMNNINNHTAPVSIHKNNIIPSIPSRSLKPKVSFSDSLVKDDNYRHDSTKLRTVNIPTNLVAIFLSLAESNTEKNIETGGHLFGKLSQNTFTVTHLVIPKQTGKSDSFSAINEEEMVDFKEAKNLLTLGWIHTHPSQTAFLSSVDLHNQFPNQQLLPEYIAIVCAPTHDQTMIFTITPDYGMNILATCKESGFHYHSQDPPLYQECKHVIEEPHLDVAVEDLRRRK